MRSEFELIQGDCLDVLNSSRSYDMIFADPFDNIGLGYDEYEDKMPDEEYVRFLANCVWKFTSRAPVVWFSFNAKWTFAMGRVFDDFLHKNLAWEGKPAVQVFTFGQHRQTDLGNNHRPLWRLKHKDAPTHPDQIRVPSWRQRNGDKRASSKGRVPGDVFDMQYQWPVLNGKLSVNFDTQESYFEIPVHPGDVFDFPRVTGNSKQRCDWHPTQLHEELVERCVKLHTVEGDRVVDTFGGTGTTLRVCRKIGRKCTLIELSEGYCGKLLEENPDLVQV